MPMCSLAARMPAAAGISPQPFLQQTGDALSPACHRGVDCASPLRLAAETAPDSAGICLWPESSLCRHSTLRCSFCAGRIHANRSCSALSSSGLPGPPLLPSARESHLVILLIKTMALGAGNTLKTLKPFFPNRNLIVEVFVEVGLTRKTCQPQMNSNRFT